MKMITHVKWFLIIGSLAGCEAAIWVEADILIVVESFPLSLEGMRLKQLVLSLAYILTEDGFSKL